MIATLHDKLAALRVQGIGTGTGTIVIRALRQAAARSNAVTAYREFPNRSHYTIGEPGWEQVADYALTWAMDSA